MDEATQTPQEGVTPKKVLAVEDDLFLKELIAGKFPDD